MATLQAARDNRVIVEDDLDWSEHDNCAHIPNAELRQAIEDAEAGRNLIGPFATAEEAFRSMMAGMEALDDDDEDVACLL